VRAQASPGEGEVVIFNRSHYEGVLVERVHKLVPVEVWRRRYREINDFEKLLSENDTTILKFPLTSAKMTRERGCKRGLMILRKNGSSVSTTFPTGSSGTST